MPNEDFTSQILATLAALPQHAQAEAMTALISSAIKTMSIYRVLEVRQQILAELDPRISIVQTAIEVIDSQIALREIAGSEGWR